MPPTQVKWSKPMRANSAKAMVRMREIDAADAEAEREKADDGAGRPPHRHRRHRPIHGPTPKWTYSAAAA